MLVWVWKDQLLVSHKLWFSALLLHGRSSGIVAVLEVEGISEIAEHFVAHAFFQCISAIFESSSGKSVISTVLLFVS